MWHKVLFCLLRLQRHCDTTCASVWHDSPICLTWLIHICDIPHPRVTRLKLRFIRIWHDSNFIHIWLDSSFIHTWQDSSFIYTWYDSNCALSICDMTHMTQLLSICDMTQVDSNCALSICDMSQIDSHCAWSICDMTHVDLHVTWLMLRLLKLRLGSFLPRTKALSAYSSCAWVHFFFFHVYICIHFLLPKKWSTCMTCLIRMYDMRHAHVWHDSSTRVTRLIDMCDMTHSYVKWLRSRFTFSVCVMWLIHMCNTIHLYVRHDSFICATWLIHMCDMTHLYVWHDSFICVIRLIRLCDVPSSYVWCDSFMCVTWLSHVCDVTPSYVWHDLFTYSWLLEGVGRICLYARHYCIYVNITAYFSWWVL